MGKKGKLLGFLSAVIMTSIAMAIPAFAAKKITEVSLTVKDEIEIGERCTSDDIEVTSKSKKYTVGEIEILNEIDEWGPSDMPEVEVTLNAEDGYYFSINASTITVKGGTYVSGKKGDNQYSVILKLRLPALTGQVGNIDEAGWSSQTVASWSAAYNAGNYEISLYRDGKKYGMAQSVAETSFDFAPFMKKAGTYTYKVRGVNRTDESSKSEWYESQSSTYIDEATAENFRKQYGDTGTSGVSEPGQMLTASMPENAGWQKDGKGWWYRNADGSYPTNGWQQIDGKWFYFDSVGYMVTGWIQWNENYYYCTPEYGDMLTDTVVPDGSGRRVDTTGAWIR